MIELTRMFLQPHHSIREAMEKINETSNGFVIVVDDSRCLVGVISDGDIRRSILKGMDLATPLMKVMNTAPTFLFESSEADEQARRLMAEKLLQGIPILDVNRRVLRIILKRQLDVASSGYQNPIVIMAGGRGSRLGDLTQNCPKPLLEIDGIPLIERSIRNFAKQGFKNIYVSTNYRREMIKEHLKDGQHLNVNLQYLSEDMALGTAGALHMLPAQNNNLPLIVINGDILTSVHFEDLLDYHLRGEFDATMCVRSHEFQIPFGVVNVNENKIQDLQEKPAFTQLINAGVYVINPYVIKSIPHSTFYNMTTLFQDCIEKGRSLGAYVINGYWMDIGHKDDLEKAQQDIKKYNL